MASKHYGDYDVTKTIYNNKGNEISSYTYQQFKKNITEEYLFENSTEGNLELEIYFKCYKGKRYKVSTKKVYYH